MNGSRMPLALVAGFVVAGCQAAAPDLESEKAELMQLSRDWSDVVATGDLEAILAGWAEDAVMLPPDLPAVEGKAAIREYVEGAARLPGFSISWEPVSAHIARSGDMAYMLERNVITVNDSLGNPVTTHGKVVTIWRKDADGNWKNVIDMWNRAPGPDG